MPKMTIDFMDGSREVFEVPQQTDHLTARRVRLDMFLEGRYLILEDENLEKGGAFLPDREHQMHPRRWQSAGAGTSAAGSTRRPPNY